MHIRLQDSIAKSRSRAALNGVRKEQIMRKIKWKQGVAVLAAISLLITGTMVPGGASAKGKIKLNKKKVTIKVGQKVKLKLKNTKKKKELLRKT